MYFDLIVDKREKVEGDTEIQEWARCLACPASGCGIKVSLLFHLIGLHIYQI